MYPAKVLLGFFTVALTLVQAQCPDYAAYSTQKNQPLSSGKYQLGYQRPDPSCRTFSLPEVEQTIEDLKDIIKDPDLFRLFENTFPNTLDTTISWKGFADGSTGEEVVITP